MAGEIEEIRALRDEAERIVFAIKRFYAGLLLDQELKRFQGVMPEEATSWIATQSEGWWDRAVDKRAAEV